MNDDFHFCPICYEEIDLSEPIMRHFEDGEPAHVACVASLDLNDRMDYRRA